MILKTHITTSLIISEVHKLRPSVSQMDSNMELSLTFMAINEQLIYSTNNKLQMMVRTEHGHFETV